VQRGVSSPRFSTIPTISFSLCELTCLEKRIERQKNTKIGFSEVNYIEIKTFSILTTESSGYAMSHSPRPCNQLKANSSDSASFSFYSSTWDLSSDQDSVLLTRHI
jgi:hypothetical protein